MSNGQITISLRKSKLNDKAFLYFTCGENPFFYVEKYRFCNVVLVK
jgi:hypothetical protein